MRGDEAGVASIGHCGRGAHAAGHVVTIWARGGGEIPSKNYGMLYVLPVRVFRCYSVVCASGPPLARPGAVDFSKKLLYIAKEIVLTPQYGPC